MSEASPAPIIIAQQVGNCGVCSKPLFVTTTCCPDRRYSRGYPIPRMPGGPPCPVEDGTLQAAIDASSVSEERAHG